jgi:organic hydroperoxide reductase OsmC/OhrA
MGKGMKISAQVQNSEGQHHIVLQTNVNTHSIHIPPKASGYGSSANGGEVLFLALATCYCNDIYREAAKRGISVHSVEVHVEGEFGAEAEPAKNVSYHASVTANTSEQEILSLMRDTDHLAETQNTLRIETPVQLGELQAVRVQG